MTFYSIGEVAERCGINPVTLRAWQRRYALLKPKRTEGGHRQFDEEDIQRIEEIKRWISSGVPVGKVKQHLDDNKQEGQGDWLALQEKMLSILRRIQPDILRKNLITLLAKFSANSIIDNIWRAMVGLLTYCLPR